MSGRKEMFYLMMHSTHFILWLYGVGHMVKDHSDSERGNPLPTHMGYSFRLTARVILYAPSHRQDSTYHGLCYTSRGAMTLDSIIFDSVMAGSDDPSNHERTLYLAPFYVKTN